MNEKFKLIKEDENIVREEEWTSNYHIHLIKQLKTDILLLSTKIDTMWFLITVFLFVIPVLMVKIIISKTRKNLWNREYNELSEILITHDETFKRTSIIKRTLIL